jgi:hypothetical protein
VRVVCEGERDRRKAELIQCGLDDRDARGGLELVEQPPLEAQNADMLAVVGRRLPALGVAR